MGVPQSSSILMRFSVVNQPFAGPPIYGKPQIYLGHPRTFLPPGGEVAFQAL